MSNNSNGCFQDVPREITDEFPPAHLEEAMNKYIKSIQAMNKSTAHEYLMRLSNFRKFILIKYKITLDDLITQIKQNLKDPYDIFSEYISHLQSYSSISTTTLKQRVVTAKNFLEYSDIDIMPRKFKVRVKIPRSIRRNKEALSKEDVVNILNSCSDIRLKTYVMLLAATGFRAVEALSIRLRDLRFESTPSRVFVRGEYTKTKTDRYVYLTEELVNQLKQWIEYKYRTRRVCYKDKHTGKTVTEYRTPQRNENDLVAAVHSEIGNPLLRSMYYDLSESFAKLLDRIGKGAREDGNERRRQITLHSFRRFVKTTISDLGYSDFSEYFIGHSGSTYWRKKEAEKGELFKKVEPYLTFLDFVRLERKGADVQTKVEHLETENQRLRHSDQMKEDALATLSDQVMKLMVEVQELKRHN